MGFHRNFSSTQTHPVLIFVIFLARQSPVAGRTVSPLMVFSDWLSCPSRWLPPAASPGTGDPHLTSDDLPSAFFPSSLDSHNFSSASRRQFSRNKKMKGGPLVQLAAATSQLASIVCDRFQGMCLTERVLLRSQTRFYVCARVCRGANTSAHLKTSICFLYFFFCTL